jgi:hypothetical protein
MGTKGKGKLVHTRVKRTAEVQLHPFLTLLLDWGVWSTSRPGEIFHITHRIGGFWAPEPVWMSWGGDKSCTCWGSNKVLHIPLPNQCTGYGYKDLRERENNKSMETANCVSNVIALPQGIALIRIWNGYNHCHRVITHLQLNILLLLLLLKN